MTERNYGSADSTRYLQIVNERFGAVVSCADGDAESVEQGSQVEVVNIADVERDDGIALSAGPVDFDVVNGL